MAEEEKKKDEPEKATKAEAAKAGAPSVPHPEVGDIVEDEDGPDEHVVIALSRTMGAIARNVRRPVEIVSRVLFPRSKAGPEQPDPVPGLLKELGALVSANSAGDYAGLDQSEEFWKLVARLAVAGRKKRLGRPSASSPKAKRRAKAAATKAVAVAGDAAKEEKKAAAPKEKAKPEKKPETENAPAKDEGAEK